MDELLSIGEMAKLNNVSIQRLRYYDNIGLFSPAHINEQSNYRYYTSEQSAHLAIIKQLQYIGLSLLEIKQLFEDPLHRGIEEHLSTKMDYLIRQEERIQRKKDLLKSFQHTLKADNNEIKKITIHHFIGLFIGDITQDLPIPASGIKSFYDSKVAKQLDKLNISKAYLPHFYVNGDNFQKARIFIRSVNPKPECELLIIPESDYYYCYSDEDHFLNDCKRLKEKAKNESNEYYIEALPKIDQNKIQNYLIYLRIQK